MAPAATSIPSASISSTPSGPLTVTPDAALPENSMRSTLVSANTVRFDRARAACRVTAQVVVGGKLLVFSSPGFSDLPPVQQPEAWSTPSPPVLSTPSKDQNYGAPEITPSPPGRMRQAARAAIEGDLVERSFDRLIHKDKKIAFEAFVLTWLLVKTDETGPIYKALADHTEEKVKLALLHVLQTVENEHTFQSLSELLIRHALTPDVTAKVNEVRSCSQLMSV